MLRKASLLMSCIILSFAFTACNTGGKKLPKLNPENPVNLTLWHYYNGHQKDAFDKLVAEFNDSVGRDKGIILEAVSQGGVNELADKLLAAAKDEPAVGKMPDIFGAYSDTLFDLDAMDKVAELDNYLTEKEINEYVGSFIEEGRSLPGGKLKLFPIAKSTEILYVNKTDWDNFLKAVNMEDPSGKYPDISKEHLSTWEGLSEAAQCYYNWTDDMTPDVKGNGKILFGFDSLANFQLIANKQLGIDLLTMKDGRGIENVHKSAQKKIWDFYHMGIASGYFGAVGRFRSDDVKTGNVIMYIGSSSASTYMPTQVTLSDGKQTTIESMVLPLPTFKEGSKVAIQQGAGMAVKKSTPEQEYAAVIFLRYFTEVDKNINFIFNSGYLPVKKEALESKLISEKIKVAKESINSQEKNLALAMEVSVKQLNDYAVYYSPPFPGSYNVRKEIDNITLITASDARKKVESYVSAGLSYNAAILKATDETSFDSYSNNLRDAIRKEIK